MLTIASLRPNDIPAPEYAYGETIVYSKRRGVTCEWRVSKGREHGRIYYCLRLADGFRTYASLAALKSAVRA